MDGLQQSTLSQPKIQTPRQLPTMISVWSPWLVVQTKKEASMSGSSPHPQFSQKWPSSLLSKHYELTCFSALDAFPCAESAQLQPQHRQPVSILKVLEHSTSLRNLAPFGKEMLLHSGLSVNDINCSLTTYVLVFSLGRPREWKWL